jgi:hypothetical protein
MRTIQGRQAVRVAALASVVAFGASLLVSAPAAATAPHLTYYGIPKSGCGLGAELALVLPALAALGARQRHRPRVTSASVAPQAVAILTDEQEARADALADQASAGLRAPSRVRGDDEVRGIEEDSG